MPCGGAMPPRKAAPVQGPSCSPPAVVELPAKPRRRGTNCARCSCPPSALPLSPARRWRGVWLPLPLPIPTTPPKSHGCRCVCAKFEARFPPAPLWGCGPRLRLFGRALSPAAPATRSDGRPKKKREAPGPIKAALGPADSPLHTAFRGRPRACRNGGIEGAVPLCHRTFLHGSVLSRAPINPDVFAGRLRELVGQL